MPQVVTCLLEHGGKILLLKRSNMVGTYRGLWGGVAGYVEDLEDPYMTAVKEISQETGIDLDALMLVKKGDPIEFSDTYEGKRYDWVVYPFLFHIEDKGLVRIDWEHEEYRWVSPSEVKKLETVPGLDEVVAQLISTTDIL
ncbi:MAG TPA: NUDIX pyrophosphatase [Thermoplasmata archaeon]|jgi:8-oxo-dGTP pyrophosphatase MutT (NUDIX family)|nr:MAG TPA: NUDIX pyrophosphatase [Thermoplasmata archaeon]